MSIAQKCPYENENCKYEIFVGEPIFKKCKFCSRNSGNKGKQIEGVTMFEKEAEEKYCKGCKLRIEQCLWAWRNTNGLNEPNEKNCSCIKVPAYIAGAEFGYNKANEWHYIEDEFPPEHVPLNIITLDKNKKRRLWTGEYKGGNGQFWTGYFNHFIDVPYAWKEIVLPELPGGD